jgi:membrane protease YdiL (CAAX protease family)
MSKGVFMGLLIEPLILYIILFLPGAINHGPLPELTAFSTTGELKRILLFNTPSLALIWYLILRPETCRRDCKYRAFSPRFPAGQPGKRAIPRFRRQDLYSILFAFPALLLTGFCISLVSSRFYEIPAGMNIEAPPHIAGWVVMVLSCLSTGYLEETYFRYYLLEKLEIFGLSPLMAILMGVLLFSFCHLYEGPWGVLNAFLAGVILSLIFVRFQSLHGIALTHGLYNVFVYAMGI